MRKNILLNAFFMFIIIISVIGAKALDEDTIEKQTVEEIIEESILLPLQDKLNLATASVSNTIEDKSEILFGSIAIIILVFIALTFVAYYGGFPIPLKSKLDRAVYFHKKAEIKYKKGNYKRSQHLYKKAQILREKAERFKRR